MTERKPHPDFLAAPERSRWAESLPELFEILRHEAYGLAGEWAWRILPRGALIGICVPPSFQKQLRIARRPRKGLTDKTAKVWHTEVRTFLEHMGCEDWKVLKNVIEPGDPPKLEVIYEEPLPLGARKALQCGRCGGVAEPGSEKYKERICNACALELGRQEIEEHEKARLRLESTR
jgi:hypothetical protein